MYRDASLALNTQAVPLEAALAQWAAGVTYGSRVGATEQGYLSLNYTAEDGGGVDESFRAMWPEYLDVLSEPLRKMQKRPDIDDHQHGTAFGKGISYGLVEASVQLDPDVISRIAKTKGGPTDASFLLQHGLLSALGDGKPRKVIARFSHSPVLQQHLSRMALKIEVDSNRHMDLVMAEVTPNMPIEDRDVMKADFAFRLAHFSKLRAAYYGAFGAGGGLKFPRNVLRLYRNSQEYKKRDNEATKLYSVLGDNFYVQVPYQAGLSPFKAVAASAMKMRLVPEVRPPSPPGIFSCKGNGTDDPGLSDLDWWCVPKLMMKQFLEDVAKGPTKFHLEVQVASDPVEHPLNNAYSMWEGAPWVRVGMLSIPQQEFFRTDGTEYDHVSTRWKHVSGFYGKDVFYSPWNEIVKPVSDIMAFRAWMYPRYDRLRVALFQGRGRVEI